MGFRKAEKARAKLRAALFGPSGAGKTYSALAIATGLGEKIALIDSERGSAEKYADIFEFDVVDLEEKNVDEYVAYIKEAEKHGYDVLVIDSLTHAWQELLADIDKIAQAKYRGNTWSAWSEGTPKQKRLIDALLSYNGHIIATMRSKTEWTVDKNDKGKTTPTRVGLAPEQGKGIEYEFDLLAEISPEHIMNIIKDRTGKFQDKLIEKPGKDFGVMLKDWLNSGVDRTDYKLELARLLSSQYVMNKTEMGETVKAIAAGRGAKSVTMEVAKSIYNDILDKKVDPIAVLSGLKKASQNTKEEVEEAVEATVAEAPSDEFYDESSESGIDNNPNNEGV